MEEQGRVLTVPEALVNRRATRRFDPNHPLSDDLLKRILGLAACAPSSTNLQPWRFLVVRTEKNRARLRACAFNQPKVTDAPVMVIVLGYKNAYETHLEPMLANRVELGAMTTDGAAEVKARVSRSFPNNPDLATWALRSSMLASMSMLVAAESLGVASAPMEGFDHARVKEEFGVPDDHIVCCLVALGHALATDPFPGRFGLTEVCYEEHFGQPWTLGEPETLL